MFKRLSWRHFFGGTVLLTLVFFQNCSDMGSEGEQTNLSSYVENLPFAYKASFDTVAYMSCSRMQKNYEPRAFFTFRAGAYTPLAGLEVTQEFWDATKYYSLDMKRDAFKDSFANSNTRPQLALRSTANLQSLVVNGTTKNGLSLGTMLSNLSDSPMVEHLVTMQPEVKRHYFPSGASERLLATSLRFGDGDEENVAGELRKILKNNEALLALTFTDSDNVDEGKARGPAGISTTSAHGLGYQVQFSNPYGWHSAEQRVLHSINEVSLSQGYASTSSLWNCPVSMQFVILRNEDLARITSCDMKPDHYQVGNEAQRLALDAVRRVLPVEDFYVDVVNRCVVAKSHIATQSCYGDRTGRGDVDYSSGSCSGDSCPHYVSVCVKQ